MAVDDNVWLFSYGTLQQAEVQRKLFGRTLQCHEDTLIGFEIKIVTITDPSAIRTSGTDRHPMLRRSDPTNAVKGSVLRLCTADLEAADRYEAADYERIPVILNSGRNAFVYVERAGTATSTSIDAVNFVTPNRATFDRLLPVARRIFTDAFAERYDAAKFERFCDLTYSPDGSMARDFLSQDVRWRVAMIDGEPIGYAKLTSLRAPAPQPAPGAMELQQIYVLYNWHGTGVADRLIQWAIRAAQEAGAPELYLTVFQHNFRAKRFYRRYGFEDVGRCTFQLGDQVDEDRIWRRLLVT